MKLEKIDTSTTAGKAEVMRLAAEGRKVAYKSVDLNLWIEVCPPSWNWYQCDYAIIVEPVGPREVWLILTSDGREVGLAKDEREAHSEISRISGERLFTVRYVRSES